MKLDYLAALSLRIGFGVGRLDADFRRKLVDFTWSTQTEDGGFSGRRGKGDIYYTAFALRSLFLLGKLGSSAPIMKLVMFYRDFVASKLVRINDSNFAIAPISSVELVSLLIGAVIIKLSSGQDVFETLPISQHTFARQALARLQCKDGYRASEKSAYPGMYHTFLALVGRELIEMPPSKKELSDFSTFFFRHRQSNGAFVEMTRLRTCGTNPSAAAVGLARILQSYGNDAPMTCLNDKKTEIFFNSLRHESGGFCANTLVPFPDLLSTFSAIVAILEINNWQKSETLDLKNTEDYVRSLRKNGGFIGHTLDNIPDVEYSFYGLALSSIIAFIDSPDFQNVY